jgi:hypothetical protein
MNKQALVFTGAIVLLVAATGLTRAGPGNPGDHEAARPHYAAALQGQADAQAKLGILYLKGDGVPQSDALAFQWLLRAAQQGHAEAELALSGMFAEGRGVARHDVLAYKWAALAEADATDPDIRRSAAEQINLLARRMPEGEIAEARRLAGLTAVAAPPVPGVAASEREPDQAPRFELATETKREPARAEPPVPETRPQITRSRQSPAEPSRTETDAAAPDARPAPKLVRPAQRRPGRLAQMREELEQAHRTVSLISLAGWE